MWSLWYLTLASTQLHWDYPWVGSHPSNEFLPLPLAVTEPTPVPLPVHRRLLELMTSQMGVGNLRTTAPASRYQEIVCPLDRDNFVCLLEANSALMPQCCIRCAASSTEEYATCVNWCWRLSFTLAFLGLDISKIMHNLPGAFGMTTR